MSKPEVFIGAYVAVFVVCFGFTTVDAERETAQAKRECVPQPDCRRLVWGREDKALFNAMFWPLWLSYKAAQALTKE